MTSDLDLIKCYTLIDITQTDVVQRYKQDSNTFTDNSGKQITNEQEFDYARNQQRNYETLLQVIGLRAQPIYTETPKIILNTPLDDYSFGTEYNNATVWEFTFGVEHHNVFVNETPFGALDCDINKVPVISNLNETIEQAISIFTITNEHRNVYFAHIG